MTLRAYVLLGARLRWRLTSNTLSRKGMALFVLSLVAAGLGALLGFSAFAGARWFDSEPRRALLVVGMTMLVVAWTFGPLLSGGTDETVDPSRLALIPLTTRQLTAVLAGGAASSPAVCAVGFALIGVIAGYSPAGIGALIVVADVLALFALGLGVARSIAALLASAQRSRRGRDVAVVASAMAFVVVWLATQAIGPIVQVAQHSRSSRIVGILEWLPPGWLARSILDAGDGDYARSVVGLLAGTSVAAVALYGWGRLTQRLMERSERIVASDRQHADADPLGAATTRFGAALAKERRYMTRSPLRRTQLLIMSVMGTALTVFQAIQLRATTAAPFMALIAVIFGMGTAMNILGFDSPSLWMEAVAGGPDRTVLRARSLGYLPQVMVPTFVAAIVLGFWKGHWASVAAVVLMMPSVGLIATGLGAWVSTQVAIPQRDGDNAFAWRNAATGKGFLAFAYAIGSMVVVVVLSSPILVPTFVWRERPWVFAIPVVGLSWALAVWAAGTNMAARSIRYRVPELLADLSSKAVS